ncbi:hypothetical protein HMPREF9554_02545 [Treponema phagedenis F0421]|nr:hypothetical protein HMPREF9554_02545 [Treponema phagedenis F0421]
MLRMQGHCGTPAPEEYKFQNGHRRPWFHADRHNFTTDGKIMPAVH